MLILPIKKKWYDMILSGEKKEEYREFNSYYAARFRRLFCLPPGDIPPPEGTKPRKLLIRNGYSGSSPTAEIEAVLKLKEGNLDWGAYPGIRYYTLCIISVTPLQ